MLTIKRILFPTDFSECAEHAFTMADRFAIQHQAELHVVHAVARPGENPASSDEAGFPSQDERDRLDNVRAHVIDKMEGAVPTELAYPYKVRETSGRTVSGAILSYAEQHEIDLIVMGTHGRGKVKRALMGSNAERVVRQATCPVVTVTQDATIRSGGPHRLLVPVDFSSHSETLLKYALEIGGEDAEIDVVHVLSPFSDYLTDVEVEGMPSISDLEDRARMHLEELIEKVAGGKGKCSTIVRTGVPYQEIRGLAGSGDYEMLLLSTHGRTGVGHVLIGSVAEKVLRRADCPVFVAKNHGLSLLPREGMEANGAVL